MPIRPLLYLLFLAFAACATGPAAAPPAGVVAVRGKVSLDGSGLGGVEIAAWPGESASLAGAAPYRSAPSTAEGAFGLALPPGDYYFLARGAGSFAYYGRNPVTVPAEGLDELKIGLVRLPDQPGPVAAPGETGIVGTVQVAGMPRAGAVVFAYTDLASRLKGMGYAMSVPSDENGRFTLALPPGSYYLLARLRQHGGAVTGPLRAGDFIGYAPENPLRVGADQLATAVVPLLEVPEKVERLAATLFGGTVLRGRIVTRTGAPVAGARAVLYAEAQMFNRPLFVSQPSDADGRFLLSFPEGGTYYLAARQQLGGAPAPGELYGTYDGSPDHSLVVATGEERTGIELVVEEMW